MKNALSDLQVSVSMPVCLPSVCALADGPAQFVRATIALQDARSDLQVRVSMPVCLILPVSLAFSL